MTVGLEAASGDADPVLPLRFAEGRRLSGILELDRSGVQSNGTQSGKLQPLELVHPNPGPPRLTRSKREAPHGHMLTAADHPGVSLAREMAPELERGPSGVAGIPLADLPELALDPLPGAASLVAAGCGAEVGAKEAQAIGEGHAQAVPVELGQQLPASCAERRSDLAALEVDQDDLAIGSDQEVVGREIILIHARVVKAACQARKALDQSAPLPRRAPQRLEPCAQVARVQGGHHAEAAEEHAAVALLADGNRERRSEAEFVHSLGHRELVSRTRSSPDRAQPPQTPRKREDLYVKARTTVPVLQPVEAFAARDLARETAGTLENRVGIRDQLVEERGAGSCLRVQEPSSPARTSCRAPGHGDGQASTMELHTLADAARYLEGFIDLERRVSFDYERLGSERVRALLGAIGAPQHGLPCVHIAGSKGKGSVALATERLLGAAGWRVGTYTSPHLESWRERYRIAGRSVRSETLLSALRELRPAADRLRRDPELCPSFFDVSTALALLLFRREGVQVGVIEVGLGGRLDSTNVVESRVSVLTSIQLEHTDKLGKTLAAIAREKAGILRKAVPLIVAPLPLEARGVVRARAEAVDATVEEVAVGDTAMSLSGLHVCLPDGRELRSPVLGRHQAQNLALAVRAVERFLGRSLGLRELETLRGLRLPARIERFGDLVLDCAHSPDSARALAATIRELWPGRSWTLVLSISRDKDAAGVLDALAPAAQVLILTRAEPTRSADPSALLPLARAAGIDKVEIDDVPVGALERARALRSAGDLIVVTGSVYLAGEIRARLR